MRLPFGACFLLWYQLLLRDADTRFSAAVNKIPVDHIGSKGQPLASHLPRSCGFLCAEDIAAELPLSVQSSVAHQINWYSNIN